jgi:hypothetical protein
MNSDLIDIPLALMDSRLRDLALTFSASPDANLMTGYRRLEDVVRERSKIEEYGQRLFARAFGGDHSPLCWTGISAGEQDGRVALFSAAFKAYRNPRAHREERHNSMRDLVDELLILNHLFRLEGQAVLRESLL